MFYSQPFSFLDLIDEKTDEYIYNSSVSARDIAYFYDFESFVKLGHAQSLLSSSVQAISLYPYNKDVETISEYFSELSDYQWFCQNKLFDKACGYIQFADDSERHGIEINPHLVDCNFNLSLYFKTHETQNNDNVCLVSMEVGTDFYEAYLNEDQIKLYQNSTEILSASCIMDSWQYFILNFNEVDSEIYLNVSGEQYSGSVSISGLRPGTINIADYNDENSSLVITKKSWDGCIKEFRLWDESKSSVTDIEHSIWDSDSLKIYYRFNEGLVSSEGSELYEKYFSDGWLTTYSGSLNSRVLDYSKNNFNSEISGNFEKICLYDESTYYQLEDSNFKDYITCPIIFDSYIPVDYNMLQIYDEQITLAEEFDKNNRSSLVNYIPGYIFDNEDDDSFLIFMFALSNFIDEFKIKIDRKILFENNIYSKKNNTTLDILEKKLKNYGLDCSKQFKNMDIWTKILNTKFDYFEAKKRLFDDLTNDIIAISKEKGTLASVNNILNIARVSSNLYKIIFKNELKIVEEKIYEKYINRPELYITDEKTITIASASAIPSVCTIALKFRINDIESGSSLINFGDNTFKITWDSEYINLESTLNEGIPVLSSEYIYDKNDEYVAYFKINALGEFYQGLAAVYKDILDKVFEERATSQALATSSTDISITAWNANLITFEYSNEIISDDDIRRDIFDNIIEFDTLEQGYSGTDLIYDYNFDLKTVYDYNFDFTTQSEQNLAEVSVEINPSDMIKNQYISQYYNQLYNIIDIENVEKLDINFSVLLQKLKYLDINIPDFVVNMISKYKESPAYVVENPWSIRDKEILSYLKPTLQSQINNDNLVANLNI